MIRLLTQRIQQLDLASVASKATRKAFPNLMVERLYYAEGRHHPLHPLHGSHAGLGCW